MKIIEKNISECFAVTKKKPSEKIIALIGNPNVGKSTVFNALTGLKQHTGNWPGKTVTNAQGTFSFMGIDYILVDLPGTYSMMAHSTEEEIARDFILFGKAEAVIVVCDATCLERNLNLALQVLEITSNVIICVNLLDEAKKNGISIDLSALQEELGVPVVGTSARDGKGLKELTEKVSDLCLGKTKLKPLKINYNPKVIDSLYPLIAVLEEKFKGKINCTWLALRLMENDSTIMSGVREYLGINLLDDHYVNEAIANVRLLLNNEGISEEQLKDLTVTSIVSLAEEVAKSVFALNNCSKIHSNHLDNTINMSVSTNTRDRKLDKILTSKQTGIPIMLALLCIILWLTISGANVPSQIIADALFWFQDRLTEFCFWIGTPKWMHGVLVLGMYRVLAWVVSVMLPPMAIFFPLFTLLEDFGYLPRVAFNLDHHFKKAKACGKQALTMCMDSMNLLSKTEQVGSVIVTLLLVIRFILVHLNKPISTSLGLNSNLFLALILIFFLFLFFTDIRYYY